MLVQPCRKALHTTVKVASAVPLTLMKQAPLRTIKSTARCTRRAPPNISRSRAKLVSAPAEAFEMQPGPAAAVTMEATGAIAERLTATNGSAPQHRALLRGAAAQLQDAWGNAVAQAGVRVQLSLQWPPEGAPGESRAVILSVSCAACSFQAPLEYGECPEHEAEVVQLFLSSCFRHCPAS